MYGYHPYAEARCNLINRKGLVLLAASRPLLLFKRLRIVLHGALSGARCQRSKSAWQHPKEIDGYSLLTVEYDVGAARRPLPHFGPRITAYPCLAASFAFFA